MTIFKPLRQLHVGRTLASGERVAVGTLAQNRQGIFFAYQADYLARFGNLSPFALRADTALQLAPPEPYDGLHGVFADSLPDGWGLLLQDRFFRRQGILPQQLTPLDRLAFVGHRGIGSLFFEPDQGVDAEDVLAADADDGAVDFDAGFLFGDGDRLTDSGGGGGDVGDDACLDGATGSNAAPQHFKVAVIAADFSDGHPCA